MTAAQFLEIFVSVSVQATLYVALCCLLARWTSSDSTRSQLWTYCQFGLIVLAGIACSLPHLRLIQGSEVSDPHEILATASLQTRLGLTCFLVWFAGFLCSLFWMFFSAIQMLRFLRRLTPVEMSLLPLADIGAGSPVLPEIKVFVCDALSSPFCWQFQKPVMVLPTSFLNLDRRELELVLKHELAHLEANHPLHLFVQRLVQSVYWYHPAVFWCGRQADLAREMMCDAAAADGRDEIADYLRVLLKVSEQVPARQPGALGLALLFGDRLSSLARRARRLSERARHQTSTAPVRAWLPGLALVLVTVVTTAWLPVNVLSSHRSRWSACPHWTAEILHDFGVSARDYEVYDGRLQIFDRLQDHPGHPD
ncbi:M56 family metallopeptidase [Planctomicrobium sp. SH661]|uniref:M56 family metallopeptidase n=1 Tax=Planctomicrobium sp. SH661 TaxID=3448124 RepID=UPI003F5B63B2